MSEADLPISQTPVVPPVTWSQFGLRYFASALLGGSAAMLLGRILFVSHPMTNRSDYLPVIIALVAALLSLGAAVRMPPGSRRAWIYVAAACVAWGSGLPLDPVNAVYAETIATIGYTLFAIATASAVLSFAGLGHDHGDRVISLTDFLPPLIALLATTWVLVVGTQIAAAPGWSMESLSVLVHGVGSALLMTLCVAGLWSKGRSVPSFASRFLFAGVGVLALVDPLWQVRFTMWFSPRQGAFAIAEGVAFVLIATAVLLSAIRWRQHGSFEMVEQAAPWWAGRAYYLHYFSLGALLLLSALIESTVDSAPRGELITSISAVVILVFIVMKHSVGIRQERILHDQIGELSTQLDGLMSQVGRDPLTGLLNHRAVHERLDLELAGGRASGESVAVVLIDVDNFKSINDTLGHQAGDRVLRAVSTILVSACRGTDVAARYAGDEFMLILPGLDERHAGNVCERIAHEVRRLNRELQLGGGLNVTLSVGVAVTHHCFRNVVQNIAIADAAMYDAKEGGKNQVVVVNADTLQISPPLLSPRTVDEMMAESRATVEWELDRARTG